VDCVVNFIEFRFVIEELIVVTKGCWWEYGEVRTYVCRVVGCDAVAVDVVGRCVAGVALGEAIDW